MQSYPLLNKIKFELSDGRILLCEFTSWCTPGNYGGPPEDCYPDEVDGAEDICFYLDGFKVSTDDLPKGLDFVAAGMVDANYLDHRFTISSEPL